MLPAGYGQRMQFDPLRRRQFIAGIGALAAWPMVARAQQPGRLRRIGALMSWEESDPEIKTFFSGFMQELAELGWTDGGNVRMEVRWAGSNVDRLRMFAKELVDLQPDVILATSTPSTAALQQATRTIPIVFAGMSDPVGAGFVASLSRPGGNITGFINMEGAFGGKWLEVLTEIAPDIKRTAIMFNPDTAPGGGSYYLPSFDAAARKLKVEPIAARVRSVAEIETVITSLGREPGVALLLCRTFLSRPIADKSYCSQRETMYRRSIRYLSLPETAVCFLTDPIEGISFAAQHPTSIAFSVAKSRRSFPSNCRPNLR
jgi:putative tryptophan/tyrosine transport system substrate-binding protein